MIFTIWNKNIKKSIYWLLLGTMVAFRLAIVWAQRVFLLPEGSSIDDMLMVRAAMSLVTGDWLGAYSGVSISKNMGFAPWLALWHSLGVPLLFANGILWIGACAFSIMALRPVLKGNVGKALTFGFLLFQPVSFAFFNQRAYRDSIFPAFCLLLFAGFVGLSLRASKDNGKGSILCGVGASVGLVGAWLLREDGLLLLIFAVCAAVVIILYFYLNKKTPSIKQKLIGVLLPFIGLGIGILGFSYLNLQQYGVFLVNDMTGGAFPHAYGAIVAVSQGETGFTAKEPVSIQALEKMYKEVPSMAALEPYLQKGSTLHNGFRRLQSDEYGGSFYFALRLAASPEYGNLFSSGDSAQEYWKQIETEIKQAVDENRLQSVTPKATTVPRWHSSLLMPTIKESGAAFLTLVTFQQSDPRPLESIGEPDSIAYVASFLHSPVQSGYIAGTDIPYYNSLQKIIFGICDGIIWLYRVLIWPLLIVGFGSLFYNGRCIFKNKSKLFFTYRTLNIILLLGLLFSVLLRIGVSAYLEAASFGIGVYIMYLSSAAPPLLLFCVLGFGLLQPDIQKEHIQ